MAIERTRDHGKVAHIGLTSIHVHRYFSETIRSDELKLHTETPLVVG